MYKRSAMENEAVLFGSKIYICCLRTVTSDERDDKEKGSIVFIVRFTRGNGLSKIVYV